MSKVSDYKIEKFVSLKDTPNEYVPGVEQLGWTQITILLLAV